MDYKAYLIEMDKSEGTIAVYSYYLFRFLRDICKTPQDDFSNFTKMQGLEYIRKLETTKIAQTTINKYIDAMNSFFKYKKLDLHFKKKRMQNAQFLSNVISDDEAKRLLDYLKENNQDHLYSITATLYHTGMRLGEILKLKTTDINKKVVQITGKGKTRKVFFNDKLREILIWYVNKYKIKGYIWNDVYGHDSVNDERCLHINNQLKSKGCSLNIDKSKLHCHAFRHLFCIRLLTKLSVSEVSSIVGHSSILVTSIYLKKSESELFGIFNNIA
jgi:integrase/recombinase XerD